MKPRRIPKGQTFLPVLGKARAQKAARLVVEELSRWGRLGIGPKEISAATKLPLRTVYRTLHRLEEIEEVIKVGRGAFALAATYHDITADPTAIVGIQNIRFEVTNWQREPKPPVATAEPWEVVDGGDAGWFETAELTWEGRRIVLEWYSRVEKLVVKIAAQTPIPTGRAGELKGFIDAMLGLNRGETTRINFIEANSDHRLLRVEPQYFEWREIAGWSHVIYQRAAALREEYRMAHPETGDGKPLTFEKAIELLVYGSPLARMERIMDKELALMRAEAEKRMAENPAPATAAVRQKELDRRDEFDRGFR
jgi:hypothetical protein